MDYPSRGSVSTPYSATPRSINQDYIPGSVRDAALRPVKVSASSITSSFTLGNGSTVSAQFTKTASNRNVVIAQPQVNIFIGGTDAAVNLFPGGSGINSSQYTLVVLNAADYLNDGSAVPAYMHAGKIVLTNSSGSSQNITVVIVYRYIANGGDILP
jgi:hypothetical protein